MPLNVVRRESQHIYASRLPETGSGRAALDAVLRLLRTQDVEVELAREATGLSVNEFRALRYLLQAQREGTPSTPKDLGVMLGISGATITHLVDRLEQLGDVERVAHHVDRRIKLLVPTAQGEQKILRAYRGFHDALVEVLDALPPADAATIVDAVEQVTVRLPLGTDPDPDGSMGVDPQG
jgi:DNA-binding MarR family transcriptional regulator